MERERIPDDDLTEDDVRRQRRDEEQSELSVLLGALTANIEDVIRIHDLEGRSVWASPSAERLHGRTPTSLFDVAHPEDREACQRWWGEVRIGGRRRLHWRARDASRCWRWLESSAALVQYHGAPQVLTICRDVSERRNADEALRASEAKLREAERIASLGYFESDLVADRITFSEGTRRIHDPQFQAEELSWQELLEKIHPDDRPIQRRIVDEALEARRPYDVEYRIVRPDGEVRSVHARVELVLDESGRPIRLFGTVQDITERRNLEAQLRQAQKLEAVGQLAGGVAHDFNNHLQLIVGYGNLAMVDCPRANAAQEYLQQILDVAQRATTLVRQLLTYSRRQQSSFKTVSLDRLIWEMTRMLTRLLGEQVELELDLAEGLPSIHADPCQLEQVLMNLCINARDAMPGGGRLVIATRDYKVVDHVRLPSGDYVELRVSDTGEGIPEAISERIFEPFFTTKEVGVGTGLGLATVYGIVEQHRGTIEVESSPGQGSTFRVILPALASEVVQQARAARGSLTPAGARSETVLLAEDDEKVRDLWKTVLERAGYQVVSCRNGQEALSVVERARRSFDAAVLDVGLPGLNGVEVFRALRRDRSALPVLFTTGYEARGLEDELGDDEHVALLRKPVRLEELLKALRRLLDGA